MNPATQRLILIGTVILMILFVLGNFFLNFIEPSAYTLNTMTQPTIGNPKSSAEVVVFLDPKCAECKDYNNTIFPQIQKKYIDTNTIKYSTIITSSIDGSQPMAEALLCTYYQDENAPSTQVFFSFLNTIYLNQAAPIDTLLALAEKANPDININRIKRCMDKNVYYTKLMQNTSEARRVTSGKMDLPAVFINGTRVDANAETIFKAIDKVLGTQ